MVIKEQIEMAYLTVHRNQQTLSFVEEIKSCEHVGCCCFPGQENTFIVEGISDCHCQQIAMCYSQALLEDLQNHNHEDQLSR